MSKMFCITHGYWADPSLMDYVPESCIFVTSLPPELPANWVDTVSEPTPDEIAVMDENALSLMADFELER